MLGTNRDVFAINLSELGCTDLHPHRIDTGDAAPVRQRFYRQSPAMKTESSKHIKEMLDNNIIEPSQSEWASPVCLVRKKGSTSSSSASNQPQYRFCIDFRQLNLLCVKRVYPIVQMDDIVDMLGEAKAKFYSTVDMFNGYHQIKLDPETKHKTAFTCHEGVFEFNRLPFGLSNSPHTFQLVMSEALRGINWKSALLTANGNADALSRRPYGTEIVTITTATVESSTQTEATFIELDAYASICEITTSSKEKVVNDQRTDENFKDVIKYILDKELPIKTRQARKTVIESQDYIIDDDERLIGNADALSRRPYGTEIVTITTATVESSTQTEATFIELDPYASICEITTSPKEKVVNDQRTDENFKDVIKYILDKELPIKTRQARKTVIESQDYIIDDDVLFHLYYPKEKVTERIG
ncbi:unnamed protein product [Mytilus coruscus]|uniref:Reverse transcriptase domain-containing protein n=1 Tax=Mytilus coruscus TaxID=42192 RepID=A0A6J8D9H7_MYTCO|nr:unnamed protein product [Mytilus coruscus]